MACQFQTVISLASINENVVANYERVLKLILHYYVVRPWRPSQIIIRTCSLVTFWFMTLICDWLLFFTYSTQTFFSVNFFCVLEQFFFFVLFIFFILWQKANKMASAASAAASAAAAKLGGFFSSSNKRSMCLPAWRNKCVNKPALVYIPKTVNAKIFLSQQKLIRLLIYFNSSSRIPMLFYFGSKFLTRWNQRMESILEQRQGSCP